MEEREEGSETVGDNSNTGATKLSVKGGVLFGQRIEESILPHVSVSGTFESPEDDSQESRGPSDVCANLDVATKTKHPRGILRKSSSIGQGQKIIKQLSRSGVGISRFPSHGLSAHLQSRQFGSASTQVSKSEGNAEELLVPVRPAMLFPKKPPVVTPSEAHRLIDMLESRVKMCEQLVGGGKSGKLGKSGETSESLDSPAWQNHVLSKSDGSSSAFKNGMVPPSETMNIYDVDGPKNDEASNDEVKSAMAKEWTREVSQSISGAAGGTLSVKLRGLQKLTESVYSPKFVEFERKCNAVESWIESEHGSVSQIILSTQAKRLFVLEHENFLHKVALQLKTFDELKSFANPPYFGDLPNYEERLSQLESTGCQLGDKITALNEDLHCLALAYSTAMTVVTSTLREWSEKVTSLQEARKIASRKVKRKNVAFAVDE